MCILRRRSQTVARSEAQRELRRGMTAVAMEAEVTNIETTVLRGAVAVEIAVGGMLR